MSGEKKQPRTLSFLPLFQLLPFAWGLCDAKAVFFMMPSPLGGKTEHSQSPEQRGLDILENFWDVFCVRREKKKTKTVWFVPLFQLLPFTADAFSSGGGKESTPLSQSPGQGDVLCWKEPSQAAQVTLCIPDGTGCTQSSVKDLNSALLRHLKCLSSANTNRQLIVGLGCFISTSSFGNALTPQGKNSTFPHWDGLFEVGEFDFLAPAESLGCLPCSGL